MKFLNPTDVPRAFSIGKASYVVGPEGVVDIPDVFVYVVKGRGLPLVPFEEPAVPPPTPPIAEPEPVPDPIPEPVPEPIPEPIPDPAAKSVASILRPKKG